MRPDQIERLAALRDELTDTALQDADPAQWVGAGKAPADMTQQERGDAYWCRKMATATVSLLTKVHSLINTHGAPTAGNQKDDGDLDRELAAAEREAAAILERIQKGGHVH